MRYPWNFLFTKSFWGKKSSALHHPSIHVPKSSEKMRKNKAMSAGKDGVKPAIEAISLDMKQQELESRYEFITLASLITNFNLFSF